MTAVEFLIDRLEVNKIIPNPYPGEYWNILKRGALEMEKEQIVTTWNTAHQAGRFEGKGIAEENWQTFESYWEENFKSE